MMRRSLRSVSLLAYFLSSVNAGLWHLADVPSLVCPGAPGALNIGIWPEDLPLKDTPYIVTIFRTSSQAVTLTFNVTDQLGAVVISNVTVDLPNLLESPIATTPTPWAATAAAGALPTTTGAPLAVGAVPTVTANLGEWQPPAATTPIPMAPLGVAPGVFATTTGAPGEGALLSADGRRLAEPVASNSAAEDGCEDFFLMDGRSSVELPTTWAEAREAFVDICQTESADLGMDGCSETAAGIFGAAEGGSEEEQLHMSPDFCARLREEASIWLHGEVLGPGGAPARSLRLLPGTGLAAAKLRRLKGGYNGLGWNRGHEPLKRSYPSGYLSTPYGYSGRFAYTPALMGGIGLALPAGLLLHHQYYSRYESYCRTEAECPGYAETPSSCDGALCVKNFTLPEAANRDDLMNTGFYAEGFTFPFSMNIAVVAGPDYAPGRICKPEDASSTGWKPPLESDLFITFSQVEDADEGVSATSFFWFLLLCCMPCLCTVCCDGKSQNYNQVQAQEYASPDFQGNMGGGGVVMGANGELFPGARVQTQWTREEGGDGRWCPGVVRAVHAGGTVEIAYDDGDSWMGPPMHVYLQGA